MLREIEEPFPGRLAGKWWSSIQAPVPLPPKSTLFQLEYRMILPQGPVLQAFLQGIFILFF